MFGQESNVFKNTLVSDKADLGLSNNVNFTGHLEAGNFICDLLEQGGSGAGVGYFNLQGLFIKDQLVVFRKRHQNRSDKRMNILFFNAFRNQIHPQQGVGNIQAFVCVDLLIGTEQIQRQFGVVGFSVQFHRHLAAVMQYDIGNQSGRADMESPVGRHRHFDCNDFRISAEHISAEVFRTG